LNYSNLKEFQPSTTKQGKQWHNDSTKEKTHIMTNFKELNSANKIDICFLGSCCELSLRLELYKNIFHANYIGILSWGSG